MRGSRGGGGRREGAWRRVAQRAGPEVVWPKLPPQAPLGCSADRVPPMAVRVPPYGVVLTLISPLMIFFFAVSTASTTLVIFW